MTRRAADAGKKIVRTLTPMARAVAAGPEVHGCALNVSFLIDRSDSDRFRAEAQTFANTHRALVELRIAGPLPCYSFVSSQPARTPAAGS